jgi:hypothetical protein
MGNSTDGLQSWRTEEEQEEVVEGEEEEVRKSTANGVHASTNRQEEWTTRSCAGKEGGRTGQETLVAKRRQGR